MRRHTRPRARAAALEDAMPALIRALQDGAARVRFNAASAVSNLKPAIPEQALQFIPGDLGVFATCGPNRKPETADSHVLHAKRLLESDNRPKAVGFDLVMGLN